MARAICTVRTGAISIASGTTKTLIQLQAPTNQGVAWLRCGIALQGVSVTDAPGLVSLVKQTDAGTMSTYTEVLVTGPGASITPQAVATTNASAEPTTTDIVDEKYIHPQTGFEWVFQEGQDELTYANARYAIRIVSPASPWTSVNAVAWLWWEE
jgi:hypothetical protein